MALVLAALASTGATPAFGRQPSGEPAPPSGGDVPSVNSWALSPTGVTPGQPENPGSRPYLSYDMAPGATINDSVSVFNYGNVQLTFKVYATDAFNDTSGAFDLLPGDKPPADVGTWVTLPQRELTVPARSRIDLPITVSVPPDASPGDHSGAILAASQVEGTGPNGKIVNVDRRAGSRLYLRVAGPLDPRIVVDRVKSTYHWALNPLAGSLDVTYTLRNAGNIRLPAHQRLAVKAPFGLELDQRAPADVPELLPGNSVTLRAHFSDVPAAFRDSTTVSVTPVPPAGATSDLRLVAAARVGATWAIPWSVLAFVALVLIVVWLYRRRRRAARGEVATPAKQVANAA